MPNKYCISARFGEPSPNNDKIKNYDEKNEYFKFVRPLDNNELEQFIDNEIENNTFKLPIFKEENDNSNLN